MNCIAGCLRGNIVKSVPLIVLWMVISGFFHCSMPTAETVYTLENSHLKVQINPEGFVLDVTDKKTDITYRTESKGSLRLVSESCSTDSCIFGYTASPDNFEFGVSLKLEDNSIVFAVIADPAQSMTKSLNFPGVIRSSEDDYYVIPYAAGIINSVKESYPLGYPRGHFQLWAYKSTMPFAGVTNLESGYMICSDDPWDTEINVVRPDYSTPFYTLQINHHPSKSKFGYTRTFYLTFFESGGYVAMCEWYRRHAESKGYVRTLRDKARANNNIDRLIGAVDLWALHQFRSEYFIDKLRGYGFDRMAFELPMNWNTPDYHPELIDYANGHGFLTSRYDCLTDVYPPTYPDNPYFLYAAARRFHGDEREHFVAFDKCVLGVTVDDAFPEDIETHVDHFGGMEIIRNCKHVRRVERHLTARIADILLKAFDRHRAVERRRNHRLHAKHGFATGAVLQNLFNTLDSERPSLLCPVLRMHAETEIGIAASKSGTDRLRPALIGGDKIFRHMLYSLVTNGLVGMHYVIVSHHVEESDIVCLQRLFQFANLRIGRVEPLIMLVRPVRYTC